MTSTVSAQMMAELGIIHSEGTDRIPAEARLFRCRAPGTWTLGTSQTHMELGRLEPFVGRI